MQLAGAQKWIVLNVIMPSFKCLGASAVYLSVRQLSQPWRTSSDPSLQGFSEDCLCKVSEVSVTTILSSSIGSRIQN